MKYKMLALDIDGTLTNSDKKITPETASAVTKLQQRGVCVVIATGRSEFGIRHLADGIGLGKYNGYIMAFNGGRIINYSTGEVVYDNPLSLTYLGEIYEAAVKCGLGIVGYEDGRIVSGNGIDGYQEFNAWANKMELKEIDDFTHYFRKEFNKCLLTGHPDRIRESLPDVRSRFEGRLDVFTSEECFIEVVPQGVNKGAALCFLADKLGCPMEQVVSVGDGMNDLSMIECAGLGVAMGNAGPVIKERADFVTGTNDEDGVLMVIDRFFDVNY